MTASEDTVLDQAREIARAIQTEGGRALVVGGWVRDRLLGLPAKDLDIEVFGLTAARVRETLERLGPVNTVGESFTVYKLGDIDVSLPRRESKTGRGHKGFDIVGDPDLSFPEAARRRDFTINAIGWDPLLDEYLDPYHGREDLEHNILRVVDQSTFADDSLRVLRAVQLAARFELGVTPETESLCGSVALDDLPAERIWGEIQKLLLQARRPSLGLELARKWGVTSQLFPELEALVGCEQEPDWHPEGDVWVHTLLVVDQARQRLDGLSVPEQITLMLGALTHDFGKPATTAVIDGRIRSMNHEEAGVGPTLAFLDRLKVFTIDGYEVRKQVVGLVANHLKPGMWYKAPDGVGDGAFRRLALKVDLELLARLATADCLGRTGVFDCSAMAWFLTRARQLGVEHDAPTPLLLGRHLLSLGMQPGPQIGHVLKRVYERQLDGDVKTLEDALTLARELLSPGPHS